MGEFQIYDYEKMAWKRVSKEEWDAYNGYKQARFGSVCYEYNKPEVTCRRFYTVEMVRGSGRMSDEFNTYEEAYDALCKAYVREVNEGYAPTLYEILRHSVTYWNGHEKYVMIQATWDGC